MTVERLGPPDYRIMPWRNGGGQTTEIAVFPAPEGGAAAVASAFDWRISLADLAGSGPFSAYPGYDRVIFQVEGEPMTLRHAGRGETSLQRLRPYRFKGEWETFGELPRGPARDFNVMTRSEVTRADVSVVTIAGKGRVDVVARSDEIVVLYVLAGDLTVAGTTKLALSANETLIARSPTSLAITVKESATIAIVSIARLP